MHRRLLNPTFSVKSVQQCVPVFNAKAQRMVELMAARLPGAGADPVPLDVYHAMFMCTLDITVSKCARPERKKQKENRARR